MPDYRVYLLDKRQKIMTATWVSAEDQDGAAKFAQTLFMPGVASIEVWNGAQRLAILEPKTGPDAAG